jgi:hypothetical protein
MLEVRDIYVELLEQHLGSWEELEAGEMADFNRLLAAQGLPPIISQ